MSEERAWYRDWFKEEYLELYSNRDLSSAQKEIEVLVQLLSDRPIHRVLDVACGAGRHTAEMAKRFERVTGIDLSETLINHARIAAAQTPLGTPKVAEYVVGDMRAMPFENESFDLLTSLFNSFGYVKGDENHLSLLHEWSRVLKPGGTVVLDFFNREHVLKTLVPTSTEVRNETRFEITRGLSTDGKRVEKQITRLSKGTTQHFNESVRLFSPAELQLLFTKAGFVVAKKYSGFSSAPFDERSSVQLLLIAEKRAL